MDTPNTFLDWSWPDLPGKIDPESHEFTDFEISSFFWPNSWKCWLAFLNTISPAAVLLLELRKALRVMYYLLSWGRRPVRVLSPRQGRPNWATLSERALFRQFGSFFPNLELPRSRATEFSWTSRFQNLNPHGLNSKRYNFQQIPPSELKVIVDFPKFWTKFVGAHLNHVLPRCTVILLYENEESPSLQAMCNSFLGRRTFPGAEPPAGPPKLD